MRSSIVLVVALLGGWPLACKTTTTPQPTAPRSGSASTEAGSVPASTSRAAAAPSDEAGWTEIADEDGIVVGSRPSEHSPLPVFRGVGEVEAPLLEVLAVITDADRHHEWIFSCSASALVEQSSERTGIVYNRTATPWPVPDRDVILDSRVEVLDALLDPRMRPMVMPFFDDISVPERLTRAGGFAPKALSVEEFAREETEHPNPYVALVVYDSLGKHLPALAAELAQKGLSRPEPLVREGALRALAAAEPDRARVALERLLDDHDPTLRHHAQALLAELDGNSEATMHSTVEKILILKSAPVFEKVAGEDLAPLARVASEEVYADGERVFEEGEVGDSLFVIVRGRVAIVTGSEKIAELGPGEAFGEMAVLDSAPRSASAAAEGEVELLRIGSEEFYEILHEQVEIAEGVIRMLTQRLRESTAQLSQDRAAPLSVL